MSKRHVQKQWLYWCDGRIYIVRILYTHRVQRPAGSTGGWQFPCHTCLKPFNCFSSLLATW